MGSERRLPGFKHPTRNVTVGQGVTSFGGAADAICHPMPESTLRSVANRTNGRLCEAGTDPAFTGDVPVTTFY